VVKQLVAAIQEEFVIVKMEKDVEKMVQSWKEGGNTPP